MYAKENVEPRPPVISKKEDLDKYDKEKNKVKSLAVSKNQLNMNK
jgi:hypothetical protein